MANLYVLPENTDPCIDMSGLEYRISTLPCGRYVGQVYKNGLPFGTPSPALDYEQVHAWLRLVMGEYPDSYLEVV